MRCVVLVGFGRVTLDLSGRGQEGEGGHACLGVVVQSMVQQARFPFSEVLMR